MPSINRPRIKYVSYYTDNRGKQRVRFRRAGFSVHLPLPSSPDFQDAYEDALQASRSIKAKEPKAYLHSLEWTGIALRQTSEWRALSPNTKKTKTRLLERMNAAWGDTDMLSLDVAGIMARLDKVESPTVRNRIRGLFSEMFDYLQDRQLVFINPVRDIRRTKHKSTRTPPWTDAECAAFEAQWSRGTRQRLAYELFLSTVQASVDIATLRRSDLKDGIIASERGKTKVPYVAPVSDSLIEELKHHPKTFMFLETEYGKPFSPDGFNDWFNQAAADAGLSCRSHGLRVLGCTRLAEAGCTAKEIMAYSGHKTLAEVQGYIETANKIRLAKEASRKRKLSSVILPMSSEVASD
jgi:integrase